MAKKNFRAQVTTEHEQDFSVSGGNVAEVAQQESEYTDYWRSSLISLGLLFFTVFALYWDTAASIVSIWLRSDTYAHGFLVFPISAYLIWQRREQLKRMVPSPNLLGLVVLVALLFLWVAAEAAEIQVIQQFILISLVPVLTFLCLGSGVVKAMLFPLAYLFFAVPFGEFLVPVLQDQTAWFAVKALEVSGIPVYWEGRYLSIPGGNFEVAEGCSGIRYLIASIALCSIYAYLSYRSYWRRAGFVLLGIVVPILANGARAYGIIMIAHLSEMRYATGVDHILYGWVFFGLVMALLFWFGTFWRESEGHENNESTQAVSVSIPYPSGQRKTVLTSGFAMLFLASAAYAGSMISSETDAPGSNVTLELPLASGDWSGPHTSNDSWQPTIIGADRAIYQQYESNGYPVFMYAAYYWNQTHGKELVGSLNRLYDEKVWRRVQDARLTVRLASGEIIELIETEIRSSGKRRVVWYWYDINGTVTSRRIIAKALEAWDKLRSKKVEAMLVAVATDYELDASAGRERLKSFLVEVGAAVEVHDTPVEQHSNTNTVSGEQRP